MSNPIKQLAGQTAIYGVSSMLGRLINYLLVPLYTYTLMPAQYGVVTEIYSYIAFLIVILTLGMETAFFRFTEKSADKERVYSTSLLTLIISAIVFLLPMVLFSGSLAELILHPQHPEYVVFLALILVFDATATIPFARLRIQNRAMRFVSIRMAGIFINVALNLFLILLCPYLYAKGIAKEFIALFYDGSVSVNYIFFSNVVSSGIQVLLLLPEYRKIPLILDKGLLKRMLRYALPLLVFGLAGVINETLDRVLIKYLLPADISMAQLGIYGAVYKIAILMTIFIQAYRYAAEPFFFAQAKHKDAKELYAVTMNYFVVVVSLIFLATMLYIDLIIKMVDKDFREGAHVIPVLLLANLFLGIYYNLSIWYKLTDRTRYGAWLSVAGAVITVVLNLLWIPLHGYTGSAWATLICYFSMMVLSYLMGQRFFYVPYKIGKFLLFTGSALLLYYISLQLNIQRLPLKLFVNTLILIAWIGFVAWIERKALLGVLQSLQVVRRGNEPFEL